MSSNREPVDAEFEALSSQLLDVPGVAERTLAWGLELCANWLGLQDPEAAVRRLQQCDRIAHTYCCYGIAQQIAEVLGSWDQNIEAVYTLDYDAAPDGLSQVYPLDYETTPKGVHPGKWTRDEPLIHLLVWSKHRTTKLNSAVAHLDRALAQVYAAAMGTCGLTTLLDVQEVDDAYIEQHVGSGELYGWLYLRPIRLWKREREYSERGQDV